MHKFRNHSNSSEKTKPLLTFLMSLSLSATLLLITTIKPDFINKKIPLIIKDGHHFPGKYGSVQSMQMEPDLPNDFD